jgi:hypothetical protein
VVEAGIKWTDFSCIALRACGPLPSPSQSGLSEGETAERRASIEKIIRGEWDREDEFLREKHEGLFEDTNPLQYFSKDPEEQVRRAFLV